MSLLDTSPTRWLRGFEQRVRSSRTARPVHPARAHIHDDRTFGEALADSVADAMGSWRFIIGQSSIIVVWIAVNLVAIFGLHWDPYPFILLNLLFSTQAAYAAPIIMMSQNRQAARDRIRDDLEAKEVDTQSTEVADLTAMNRQQLAILANQDEILALLKAQAETPALTVARKRGVAK